VSVPQVAQRRRSGDVAQTSKRRDHLDLGGIHIAVDGNVLIGTDGKTTTTVTPTYPVSPSPTPTKQSATLGLQDGTVYEIAIFQAERQSNASSLEVTLPPFNMSASECTPL
jgi:hypothetical protein